MRRLAVLALVALAACGGDDGGGVAGENDAARPWAGADYAYPVETMTDWVTYGDQVSTFTVVSEREREGTRHERGPGLDTASTGEWRVTVRIDETLWVRDGAVARTGELDEFVVGPWAWRDLDPPPLTVGQQYVAAFTTAFGAFGPMALDTIAPVVPAEGGPIADPVDPVTPAMRQIDRDTLTDIAGQLAATSPDPAVVPYMDREAQERSQAADGETLAVMSRGRRRHSR